MRASASFRDPDYQRDLRLEETHCQHHPSLLLMLFQPRFFLIFPDFFNVISSVWVIRLVMSNI